MAASASDIGQKTEVRSLRSILFERFLYVLLLAAASVAVLGLLLIFLFSLVRGVPIFAKVGVPSILFSTDWAPTTGQFGILSFIFGSFAVTIGALALGAPLAVSTAIFLSEVASPLVKTIVRPAVELLAGIPSVVYGFFGVIVIVPLVRSVVGGSGMNIVSGWIILAFMIVPTIAAISEDAIAAVPKSVREGSAAMGATQWQTIRGVILPAARRGIIDAIVLGTGRAVGETMAVLMVVGNAAVIPRTLADPVRTLTSAIILDMPYASGDHQSALFGVGLVLLVVSMSFVASIRLLSRKRSRR